MKRNLIKNALVVCIMFLLNLIVNPLQAQPPAYNSSEIFQQIKKLNVLGSVLYIAAHPDDENTRLLTYFSKEKLLRTGYLSLTRGDGGQNLIGDEQGVELGLIRTQELLAARNIDGAEQFFSRAYDFGYSKSAIETMEFWNHDKILNDVVWVIRNFQPDLIITRFPADERAGHGHHTASSMLANEAFKAAADPKKFPEHFQYGVKPWQAKSIFWNTFNFGGANPAAEGALKIDVGNYNSLLGKSYGEIASESRSQHKSQGFGVPKQRGELLEYFLLTGGEKATKDLLDNVDIEWSRIAGGDIVKIKVQNIIETYDFTQPEKSVKPLINLYKTLQAMPSHYWTQKKLNEVQQLIIACSGIFIEATSLEPQVFPGDSLNINFFINNRSNIPAQVKKIELENFDSTLNISLPLNKNNSFTNSIKVSDAKPLSQPYWLQNPLFKGSYDVAEQKLIGKAENDDAFIATFLLQIEDLEIEVGRPIEYKYNDPVKGEVYRPLYVVAHITGNFEEPVYLFTNNKTKTINLHLQAKKRIDSFQVEVRVPAEWKIENNELKTALNNNSEVVLKSTIINVKPNTATVTVNAAKNNEPYTLLQEQKIHYDHIPEILYYKPVIASIEKINVITKGKNIGYIIGAGDKVAQGLHEMGYELTMLHEMDITDENLARFDAVITGVRAYNVHPWLGEKYDVLMRYIHNGGNMIVQYNTSNFVSSVKSKIGPYHFTLSRTRVSDETAAVRFTSENSQFLNFPNKISEEDFKNWIQERSIYHADQIDEHYETPLSLNDPGESPNTGSLIIAKYGKGNFVYTGLVFFRQLPAGVEGAYRLLANLIALPANE